VRAEDVVTGRQLGGGGFAVVFEGQLRGRAELGAVAVKMIVDPSTQPAQLAAFMGELHTLAALRHEGVVRLLAACTRPPRQCFVMELCGPSLFDVLHRRVAPRGAPADEGGGGAGGGAGAGAGAPSAPGAALRLSWAAQVARALAYLHALRPAVIHRDIKSQNVVLAGAGGTRCKLADFGLVGTRETAAGTPAYMAPELLAAKPFSKSVDVYAFGVLLFVRIPPIPAVDRRARAHARIFLRRPGGIQLPHCPKYNRLSAAPP